MNLTYEIVLNLKSIYTQRKPNKVNKLGEGGFGLWIKILIFNLFLSIYIYIFSIDWSSLYQFSCISDNEGHFDCC